MLDFIDLFLSNKKLKFSSRGVDETFVFCGLRVVNFTECHLIISACFSFFRSEVNCD